MPVPWVGHAFSRAEAMLPRQEFPDARRLLDGIRERWGARLRIAVVGRVSAGKSTLVNAILGEELAFTGAQELTFNVNWLHHAPEVTLTVHYTDGRPTRVCDPGGLRALTVHARQDPRRTAELRAIAHLEVGVPNPWLRSFDLVDTPALDSHFGEESAKTLAFLGRTGRSVRETSLRHASAADALVLVFASGLAASEAELLGDVTGADLDAAGPLTTVGALTKVEQYWPMHPDPLAEGRRVLERLAQSPGPAAALFDLRPVAGLVGAAAGTLRESEAADFAALARCGQARLESLLARGPYFAGREYPDIAVPASRRAALLRRFGGYGVALASSLAGEGLTDVPGLREELLRRSGVTDFRRLLTAHFGDRADLIKLDAAVRETAALPDTVGAAHAPRERWQLDAAVAEVTGPALDEHAFRALRVLRGWYEGRVRFTPEQAAELRRLTAEHGHRPEDRLGLPHGTAPPELLARAEERLAYWAALDLDMTADSPTADAVRVMRRGYDLVLNELSRSAAEEARERS